MISQTDLGAGEWPASDARGRPRKTGTRHKNGHLRPTLTESPREIASRMPHRRALGRKGGGPCGGERARPHAVARRGERAGGDGRRGLRPHVAGVRGDLGQPARCWGWPWPRRGLCRLPGAAHAQVLHLRSAQADLRRGVAGAGLNRSWCCAGGACGGHSRPAMRVFGPSDAKAGANCPGANTTGC